MPGATGSSPTSRTRRAILALVLALLASVLAIGTRTEPAGGETVEVTDGELTWGFKESFRDYVGPDAITVHDGASRNEDGTFSFPVVSGQYDEGVGTTKIVAEGMVHFQQYCDRPEYGLPPGGCVLDITLQDLRLRMDGDEQTLYGHVISRALDAPAGYPMVDYGEIPIAALDLADAELVTENTTTWSGIRTTSTPELAPAALYNAGTALDPLDVTYDGPGGLPPGIDQWTPEGTTTLARVAEWGADEDVTWSVEDVFVDEGNGVVHVLNAGYFDTDPMMRALDIDTLEQVGQSDGLAPSSTGGTGTFDPATSTVFTKSTDRTSGLVAWRWDPDTSTYTLARLDHAGLQVRSSLAWSTATSSLAAMTQTTGETRVMQLSEWRHDPDEGWSRTDHQLPDVSAYDTFEYYEPSDGFGSLTALTDGSLVLARSRVTIDDESHGNLPPLRLIRNGEEIEVEAIEEALQLPSDAAREVQQVSAGTGGRAAFVPSNGLGESFVRQGQLDGSSLIVDERVTFPVDEQAMRPAFTPGRDELWVKATRTGVLYLLRGGEIVAELLDQDITRSDAIDATSGGALITGGRRSDRTYGVFKYEVAGVSPTITEHPASATVTVADGEPTDANFTATATGQPAPAVQWQVEPPGESRFSDIDGATGTELTVPASASDHGAQYRAVFSSVAGSIATDPATLTVEHPPLIDIQPLDITVDEDENATFQVRPSGIPTPDVRWQGLVDGSWTDLAPGSDAYSGVDSNTLTVRTATLAQDGIRFRAVASNRVGTVYSEPATLTVTDDGGADPDPGDGEQEITVEVPEPGPGELVWSIDGAGDTVTMSEATDAGDHWASTGELLPVVVTDTRAGGPGWSISGQVSDFTGGVPGSHLGWSPTVIAPGAGATPGAPVESGFVSGDGLSVPSALASAPAGHELGSATVGADLDLRLPIDTAPGTYEATLTITALS